MTQVTMWWTEADVGKVIRYIPHGEGDLLREARIEAIGRDHESIVITDISSLCGHSSENGTLYMNRNQKGGPTELDRSGDFYFLDR